MSNVTQFVGPENEPVSKGTSALPPSTTASQGGQTEKHGALYRVLIPLVATTAAVGLAVLGIVNWDRWEVGAVTQSTDDSYVSADVSTLSARVGGNVTTIDVADYQAVKSGQLIARIDPSQYDAAVALATANVQAANGSLTNLANQEKLQAATISAAKAQKQSAEAQQVQTKEEADRQVALRDATTKQALQQAQAASLQAVASVAVADANIEQQEAQLSVLQGQSDILKAQLGAAQANLDNALLNQKYSRIYAPFDGILGAALVHTGDYAGIGSSIMSIVPRDGFYITANFKETQLARMSKGDHADILVDTFPGQTIKGTVADMSPASGSVFALLPPDNATGNFTKIVQRVPIKIVLDPGQPIASRLRAGFSATVTVHSGPVDEEGSK